LADNRSVGVRNFFVRWGLAPGAALCAALSCTSAAPAFAPGPVCGQKAITSPTGVGFVILFANNGAVQRYEVVAKAEDPEAVNDARLSLENTYGPAGVNAPALKIISFKPAEGGGSMMVPDKAIDSCGRTLDFN
jgi:hypothetical protein